MSDVLRTMQSSSVAKNTASEALPQLPNPTIQTLLASNVVQIKTCL